MSLVEVLIVVGVMGIISLVMLTMTSNMSSSLRSFNEKIDLQKTQIQIANLLVSSNYCTCFIRPNTFNYGTSAWNSFPTSFSSSYDNTCTPLGGALLSVGSNIGNSNLKPTSIAAENITETVVGSGSFTADLTIRFDQTLLEMARKPVSVPINFRINMSDPAATRSLVSCSLSSGGGITSSVAVYSPFTTSATSASCPSGFLLSSCTVEVNSSDGQSLFYQHHVTLSGPPGQLGTCSSAMFDTNDSYRLVLICVR